jgi:tetratricopeptide (TPR) repeat protein
MRSIGLLPPLAAEARPYTAADLAARSKLPLQTIERLAILDVIEGENGRYGFRAMKAAKAAKEILGRVSVAQLARACQRIRSVFDIAEPLCELQVATVDGQIVLHAGGRIAELDGQLRLGLDIAAPDVDQMLASAEDARIAGDEIVAERLLRQALAASPKDPDTLFELGSLLSERGDFTEGIALLRRATRLHPQFADAWYNIGHAFERQRRPEEARSAYEEAARVDPGFADPLFNLGMLCLDSGRFDIAIDRFEAYLRLDPASEWAERARKGIALARLSMVQAATG